MLIIVSRVHHFFLSDESISGTELGASRTYVQIREQGVQVWPCMLPNSGVRVRGLISRMDILGRQKLSAKVLPEVNVCMPSYCLPSGLTVCDTSNKLGFEAAGKTKVSR